MANKIIGINLNGIDYDYEDEETLTQTEENASKIGDLTDLETTEKTSIVGAINEIATKSVFGEKISLSGSNITNGFTAPSDGILYGSVTASSGRRLRVNGVDTQLLTTSSGLVINISVPLKKGDIAKSDSSISTLDYGLWFMPFN